MINKKNFFKNLSITQGRHLEVINKRIQIFPEKSWKEELKLFKYTKLKFIEWVVSEDNFVNNPLCKNNGHKIINKHLKGNKLRCRSVDLEFIIKKNPLNFSDKKINDFIKKIKLISSNSSKIGVKYLIFPFLENSSPKNKIKIEKLILLFYKIKKKIPRKIKILIETDLKPSLLISFIKKMKNQIFINYDIGNSASKDYNFDVEKKYFDFVKNIHLKDRIKNGPTVRFGKGNANFKKILNFLMKSKKRYNFNLQPARSNCNKDIDEIKLNMIYIKKIVYSL